MAATLFKEVSYSLSKLINDIDIGEIGLPEIQRPFIWPNIKVRDLFDSMYRGFPVGYLLFWANGLYDGHKQIGINQKQKIARLLIVDGQQRLTSLYTVLKGLPVVRDNYRKEKIFVAFRPKDEHFEVTDAAIQKDPEYIPDISRLWSGAISRNRFVKDFFIRLRKHRDVSEDEEDRLMEAIDQLYDLQNYPFTAMELSQDVDEEQVAEVFVRINSKGTILNQADFILTLMSVFWENGRAELEEFCRNSRKPSTGEPSAFNHYIHPDPSQILRVDVGLGFRRARLKYVYSILRGKDLETEQFSDECREKQFAILKEAQSYVLNLQHWHEFLKTLLRAGFKSSQMITSQMSVLYSQIMYLIGKRDYHVELFELRDVIARWFFMTSITGRYTGSPESIMERDLANLRGVNSAREFIRILDGTIEDIFTEDYWNITLPNDLATSSSRSPSLFAYYAALNLLDAKVLFSKMKVSELLDPNSRANKSSLEKHHLFPKGYLNQSGITEIRDTNQIANYALVEWAENIHISDQSPADYWHDCTRRFSTEEVELVRYWHALPEGWQNMEYHDFLAQRRLKMAHVIRDGFDSLKK
ncbi:DUF262 domain-containing protein [candidate division KSB1 bacterium]|nr:DUF262 domain-containing protein [candidate division KSB1 bacterium]